MELISYIRNRSLLVSHVEGSYLNTDVCKFELLQKEQADPSRLVPRKPSEKLELLIVFLAKYFHSTKAPGLDYLTVFHRPGCRLTLVHCGQTM